jgi:hypothetical protein
MQVYQVALDADHFEPPLFIRAEGYKVSKLGNLYFFVGGKAEVCIPAGKWLYLKTTQSVVE